MDIAAVPLPKIGSIIRFGETPATSNRSRAKVFSNVSQMKADHHLAFGIMHFANFPSLNDQFLHDILY